jgi:hypothetical protein
MTRFIFDFIAARKLQRVWMPTFDRRCPLEAVWMDAADVKTSPTVKGGPQCQ